MCNIKISFSNAGPPPGHLPWNRELRAIDRFHIHSHISTTCANKENRLFTRLENHSQTQKSVYILNKFPLTSKCHARPLNLCTAFLAVCPVETTAQYTKLCLIIYYTATEITRKFAKVQISFRSESDHK